MKEIPLSNSDKVALVDDEDYERIIKYRWFLNISGNGIGTARTNIFRKKILMHRFILAPTPNQVIDHINHNTLDNSKRNLRICTRQQNSFNKQKYHTKNPTSTYKGVMLSNIKNKWRCRIRFDGQIICLGHFINEIDAARAYDAKAKELFGEFACLNFPDDKPQILV